MSALAQSLEVSVGELVHWLEGRTATPTTVYIKALDLVAGIPVPAGKPAAKA